MKRLQTIVICFAAVSLGASANASSQKHFLASSIDLERSINATLVPGTIEKFAGNPLMKQEHPWEPSFDNLCPSVLWDEDERIYKLWYSIFVVNVPDLVKTTPARRAWLYRESGICYATSTDGIHWTKPLFAELPFRNQPSNVVLRNAHGAGVFKDARETNPNRRYKMFFQRERNGRRQHVAVAFSPDGSRWDEIIDLPHLRARADTHNNALWAPALRRYVAITRDWDFVNHSARLVARAESEDFEHWTESQVVLSGMENHLQIYGMPVFAYAEGFLGLPAIFRTREDRLHVELAWSKDTRTWQRLAPGVPFIANSETKGDYDWGCIFAAACPIETRDGFRIYYAASDDTHFGHRRTFLALATLRPDGFVAATAREPQGVAEVVTRPLPFRGETLRVTADVADGGSLQVVMEDAETGRELSRSMGIARPGALTAAPVSLSSPANGWPAAVRVRFLLQEARLYSFDHDVP